MSDHDSKSDDLQDAIHNGKLYITIHQAKKLSVVAHLTKMDPMVKVYFGNQKVHTRAIENGHTDCVWGETLELDVSNHKGKELIRIAAYDKDIINDDKIGEFDIQLWKLLQRQRQQWIELVDLENFVNRGELQISVLWEGTPEYERHHNNNNNVSPQPAIIAPVVAPVIMDVSKSFYIGCDVQRKFLSPVPAFQGQNEIELEWADFKRDDTSQIFCFDSAGHLRHVGTSFAVHAKNGQAEYNAHLVLANGLSPDAKYIAELGSLKHSLSFLWIGVDESQGGQRFPAVLKLSPTKLSLQYSNNAMAGIFPTAPVAPVYQVPTTTSIPIPTNNNNPRFWLRHNRTGLYVDYNSAKKRFELGEAKQVWNHSHTALQFDSQDHLYLVEQQLYVEPSMDGELTAIQGPPAIKNQFAFQHGLLLHKESKFILSVQDNLELILKEGDTNDKWSLDLGVKQSEAP